MQAMSRVESIVPQLPFLRRYARALTGTQASGDAYVAAALEAMVADPSLLSNGSDSRILLYRVLSRIWNSFEINVDDRGEIRSKIDRRVESITPRPRQAFLLTSVEGFSIDEACRILEAERADVERLISAAGREIAEQVATEVLIIEDEPIIALDLETLVQELGHSVVGMARTHAEAVEMAVDRRPGLVLADIQLADGSSGIEAVNEILRGFSVPVVFITAYPERLLTGERPEPAFLITKPFDVGTVRAVVSQALFFDQAAHAPAA